MKEQKTEWTRLEFKKYLGYPQIPLCGACGGVGDHRMKGGGFYCKIDYDKPANTDN